MHETPAQRRARWHIEDTQRAGAEKLETAGQRGRRLAIRSDEVIAEATRATQDVARRRGEPRWLPPETRQQRRHRQADEAEIDRELGPAGHR